MSLIQTFIGGAIATVVLNASLSLVLPEAIGIRINKISYDNGVVTQDRTVRSDTDFFAQWAATVVDAETGDVVPGCSGNGAAPYKPGDKVSKFLLGDWVGSQHCSADSLTPGRAYELRAVWSWGADSVSATAEFVR